MCVTVCINIGKHCFLTSQDRVVYLFAVLLPWRPSHGIHSVQYWHRWIELNHASSGRALEFSISFDTPNKTNYRLDSHERPRVRHRGHRIIGRLRGNNSSFFNQAFNKKTLFKSSRLFFFFHGYLCVSISFSQNFPIMFHSNFSISMQKFTRIIKIQWTFLLYIFTVR